MCLLQSQHRNLAFVFAVTRLITVQAQVAQCFAHLDILSMHLAGFACTSSLGIFSLGILSRHLPGPRLYASCWICLVV